jgi:hypothetical protein
MRKRAFYSFGVVMPVCLVLLSCGHPESLPPAEYEKWVVTEKSGLLRQKKVNGVDVIARYIPAELLAYRELRTLPGTSFDSLVASYHGGLSFQIILRADKQNEAYSNLMYFNLADVQDLSERTRYLSFAAPEFIELKYGKGTYKPVLANFEGYSALGNQLAFQVVFVISEYECGAFKAGSVQNESAEMELTFSDPIWNLGVNHFTFEKKSLVEVPKLRL